MLVVGRTGSLLEAAVAEYERRAGRYWSLEVVVVRAARGRGAEIEEVRRTESERLLERVPAGWDTVALTRTGEPWSSKGLAEYLSGLASAGAAGAAFLVGGTFGLSDPVVTRARHRLSLSAMTLPHELARLVLAEQLYRAGTILRGEPYHKGRG